VCHPNCWILDPLLELLALLELLLIMPFRICKSFEIESGHMLSKHPDKCAFPHGHTRRVEYVLEADELDQNEMVCDFKIVKELVSDFLDRLDHSMCMNTEDPRYSDFKASYGERVIGFKGADPTTEVIAKRLFDHCREKLAEYAKSPKEIYPVRPSVRIVKVRVWETSTSWSEYWEG
jgi:6-pyruvoyltetrahydropterin/6-carboxytetrahydropterin synthase